ncbi:MAG TPA: ROK family protein [Acetobacteraceae bacterium]|nr:ROK family protein [Acetobacteraceae bacterium]
MDQPNQVIRSIGPLTLAIDIGGSHLKAGLLDTNGGVVMGPVRVNTPAEAKPEAVIEALAGLIAELGTFDRISVGFPGVVRHGLVLTAPNLDSAAWHRFPLAAALSDRFGKPARLLNDAEVQGLGVIKGDGVECVITVGTGMGFALFDDGRLTPHLELAHHPVHKGKTYDEYIGDAAYKSVGRKRWNRRVKRALKHITNLVGYDTLYIGGGNAKNIDLDLSGNIRTVSNEAGITGGVRLWDKALDVAFAGD